MKKNKKKCPVCGEKLQPMYGKLMCPSCGYSIMPDAAGSNITVSNTAANNAEGNIYNSQQNNTAPSSMFNYNNDHMTLMSSGKKAKGMEPISNKSMKGIIIWAIILIFWGTLIFSLLNFFDYDNKYDYSYENITFPTYGFTQGNNSVNGSQNNNPEKDSDKFSYPESELYRNLLENIFNKDYNKVTEEEINTIVSIRINRDDKELKCGLADGTMRSFYLFDSSYSTKDLSCFRGLQYIDVDTTLKLADIKSLKNLKGVFSDNTIKDLAIIISNPDNIVSLGSYENFYVRSLEGIDSFKNLTQLYIKSSYLSDISDLKQASKLKYLCFDNAKNVTDFTPVTYLSSLEVFDVTSDSIKNLSFLDKLNNIKEFSLKQSKIIDIAPLAKYKNSLTKLCLNENYNVKDYSVIGEFTNLTELSLCAGSDAAMPDLSKNVRLETLTLERVYDLEILSTLNNVSELYLKRCSLSTLPDLSHLTDLYYIRINDSSSLLTNLTPLTNLPSLECLDISNTKVVGDIGEIFDIPTLYELYMDDCSVCIDFSKIQGNENLEVLSMNNIVVMEYGQNEYGNIDVLNGKKVDINEGLGFFLQKFPYLAELYIAGDGIINLDFVQYLPYLEVIDVSDNYISSLAPLKELSALSVVWCKDNTITDGYDLGNNVYVVAE